MEVAPLLDVTVAERVMVVSWVDREVGTKAVVNVNKAIINNQERCIVDSSPANVVFMVHTFLLLFLDLPLPQHEWYLLPVIGLEMGGTHTSTTNATFYCQ